MKKCIAVLALATSLLFGCKKNVSPTSNGSETIVSASSVPANVITAFNTSFSTATEAEWHHGNDDNFSCQFNMDHQRHEASFDDKGHEKKHDVIALEAVPAAVLDAFRSNYQDIVYEWKLTSENEWKAHFLRSGVKWEVSLNSSGVIVKAEHD